MMCERIDESCSITWCQFPKKFIYFLPSQSSSTHTRWIAHIFRTLKNVVSRVETFGYEPELEQNSKKIMKFSNKFVIDIDNKP